MLVLTAWYPSPENPVRGIFVREHAKAARLFDEVRVLHTVGPLPDLPSLWRLEEERDPGLTEGVPLLRLWYRRSARPGWKYFIRPWSVLGALRRIAAEGFRPDVIHAHVYEAGIHAVLAGAVLGIPVVVTEHSTAFHRGNMNPGELRKARFTFKHARAALPVSRALQRDLEAAGITGAFSVVPNAVDCALFRHPNGRGCAPADEPDPTLRRDRTDRRDPADQPDPALRLETPDQPRAALRADPTCRRLLFIGLLDPSGRKGLPDLLRALALLEPSEQPWRLSVVGDGPSRAECERLARSLGLAERVVFHGLMTKREVARLMAESDLFVLPSRYETAGCVYMEAMAAGLPIIGSDVGGVPEIVDPESGILVPPGDPERLAAAVASMLRSLPRFDRRAIAERARRFDLPAVGARLHAVYRAVVDR